MKNVILNNALLCLASFTQHLDVRFIHISACNFRLFFLIEVEYSILGLYQSVYISSTPDRYFQFLVTDNYEEYTCEHSTMCLL